MKKKKHKLRTMEIHMGMFDYRVYAAIGDHAQAPKFIAKIFEEPEDVWRKRIGKPVKGQTYFKDGCCPIIWLPRFPKTPAEYGTLAHEAAHAVNDMHYYLGIGLDPKNDETFTHAVGYIVRKVLSNR